MARDLQPIVKQSRREGYALHPKAHKVLARKTGVPGAHPQARGRGGLYLTQLREKQKVRRTYGLLEKQFANLMVKATKMEGQAGENLLKLLERRLDNVVYRAGFATSRRAARQLVTHGHFMLNGKRVDIPSITVSPEDEITVRPRSQKNTYFANLSDVVNNAVQKPLSWMTSDAKKMSIKIVALPKREEAEDGINEQLIVEFYSR